MRRPLLSVALALGCAVAPLAAAAQTATTDVSQRAIDGNAPVLISAADWARMAEASDLHPMFAAERARVEHEVRAAMASGINVPLPRDPGGGATHEQHKANYKIIAGAGALYRLTGESAYAEFARDILLEYARLYPTLSLHPAGRSSVKGKLFWQALNDSVWLVYAAQGYDAIRDTLSAEDRGRIDNDVFRRMAAFLSEENPDYFDRIHNHATWAAAGVGMAGYVLRDQDLVDRALSGARRDGEAGFLRQIDLLFSPDGYYAEGPYYQRYAMAPFIIFARAIEQNEPERRIFDYRDGVLLKAVDALLQSTYDGLIIPLNDAMPDKDIRSEEIVTGVAVAFAQTGDPGLLSIAQAQGRTILSPDGFAVAEGVAAGMARPYRFRSMQLSDGADGTLGALALLRTGEADGQLLVMKNTQQGQGHGHFDRLNWLFYDNGEPIVRDYGAARFLNIEAKSGGVYLPENDSWASQTVAHNTMVVNARSQFGGDWRRGEEHGTTPLLFDVDTDNGVQIVSGRTLEAYPGIALTRTLALLEHPDLDYPLVIDLFRADGAEPATYDLPLHFNGHIIHQGFAAQHSVTERPVLGDSAGYQHLWLDAESEEAEGERSLGWVLNGRFYTYRFAASAPSRALLVESGANDPNFNLRREQALIRRIEGQSDVSFVAVLEPHGAYDGSAETVTGSTSRIRSIERHRGEDGELILVTLASGGTVALGVADEIEDGVLHVVRAGGQTYQWTGPWARFDRETMR